MKLYIKGLKINMFALQYYAAKQMLADGLTKALEEDSFKTLVEEHLYASVPF